MRYVLAILACTGICVVYALIGAGLGWKHGGGVLPMAVLFVAIGATWRRLTKNKTSTNMSDSDRTESIQNANAESDSTVATNETDVLEDSHESLQRQNSGVESAHELGEDANAQVISNDYSGRQSEANRQSDTAEKSQNETTENATVTGAERGHITKRKKHRFLKAELVVLVCVICVWVVKSATIDIDSAKGEYDQAISDHTKAIEIDPRDAYEETGQVSYVPEQQQVVINQQLFQILQARFATIKKQLHEQWKIEARLYEQTWFPNANKARTALAKLNAKYQMKELEARQAIDAQVQEIQQIQKLINDNKMSIHAGNEAVWLLVFPRETKAAFLMREIFRPVGYVNSSARPSRTALDIDKVVTGILYSEKNRSVMIEQKILHEGDIIHGVKVAKIYKDKVEFEKNGKRWTQKVGETPDPEWQ